jgi:outer membrane immunogenic protein
LLRGFLPLRHIPVIKAVSCCKWGFLEGLMRIAIVALLASVSSAPFTGAATAADVSPTAIGKAPPAPAAHNWTGCYAGIEGGFVWGRSNHVAATGLGAGVSITNGDFDASGGLVGGTLGCNYEFETGWVLGVEDDLSWLSKKGSSPDSVAFSRTGTVSSTKESWLDTARIRAGHAWDRWLVFVSGGAAIAGAEVDICAAGICGSQSKTVTGWSVGGGVEYAWKDWSFKLEYLYANFGSPEFSPPLFLTRDVKLNDNIVRVGVNYRFTTWPEPAAITTRY